MVFLSISRAISAIAYAMVLLLHFRHAQAKFGQFAVRWFQYVKVHENSVFCMPWTILAMPAVALCWGVIALFCSIWRIGFVQGPPTPPTTTDIYLSNIFMRVVITVWSVLDVASILWFVKTLKELTPGQSYAGH
ncbi:hypothetical protein D9615_007188 [Tricholomella constricta]|uniref:Uncharacterized protein n=1 Tax=Tricholomella constricta TaxID=117010 RepID=A0A8H5H8F4_9AGAR|nr:hypothetical protein D9615_007188 [Tricholomella constricta]